MIQVEPDWECTGSSPSLCRRIGSSNDPAASHTDGSSGSYFPDVPGAGWHSGGSSGHGWLVTTLGVVLAAILIAFLIAGVVYKREVIFDLFPQVQCFESIKLSRVQIAVGLQCNLLVSTCHLPLIGCLV